VSDIPNIADPEVEPSDEQLIELSARAFSSVRAERERVNQELRSRVAAARAAALASLAARTSGG